MVLKKSAKVKRNQKILAGHIRFGLGLAWPWPGGKARGSRREGPKSKKTSRSKKIINLCWPYKVWPGPGLARPRWAGLDLGLAGLGQPISGTFWFSSRGGVDFLLFRVDFFYSLGGS